MSPPGAESPGTPGTRKFICSCIVCGISDIVTMIYTPRRVVSITRCGRTGFPDVSTQHFYLFSPPLAPMTSGHSGVLMYSVFVVITLSSLRSSGQQPLSPLSIHRAMVRNCGPISIRVCTPSELHEGIIVEKCLYFMSR